MDEQTTPGADGAGTLTGSARYGFESPEGLRALLVRLHEAGPGAWRSDREAAELMRYTATRYRRLARKYGLDAWEVASAAFEVMLAPSTRNAGNPWAVVTRAVQITCVAETRAAGLLTATGRVRHTDRIAGFHDAIRFADRENLADYHPALAVNPATEDEDDSDDADRARVAAALLAIVELFVSTGWDAALVADCVEHAAYRLFPGWDELPVVRSAGVRVFPYRVLYYLTDTEVVIVAYAHNRRKPRYWEHRLDG